MALSPALPEHARKIVADHKLDIPLLRDEGNAFADKLGIRFRLPDDLEATYKQFGIDLAAHNGEPSWTLPMPARYVVDTEGVIRYAAIHADYTRRPEPSETLAAVRAL